MSRNEVPAFEPHQFLPGGHLQTILSRYLPGPRSRLKSVDRQIALQDGDRVLIHESVGPEWKPSRPMALLVHGLGGDASGIELVKLGTRLVGQGVRVVRMNLRGAGPGFGLARQLYSGASHLEVRAVAEWMTSSAHSSPLGLVGFSLGANLVLNLACDAVERPIAGLDCVLAAGAPIDLAACARWMNHPSRRFYDRQFLYSMIPVVRRLHSRFPELGRIDLSSIRSVLEFDRCYTAPRNGFVSVDAYHSECSPIHLLDRIKIDGLVIHAKDDPFIPLEPILKARFARSIELEIVRTGGHLGFISREPWGGDHRWLVSRLAAWLGDRWNLPRHGSK